MPMPTIPGVLATTFAHVPYIAGRHNSTMWLLADSRGPQPRALSIITLPPASWFSRPNELLSSCALTHLQLCVEADIWALTGRPEPRMLQGLTTLTHLALDVNSDNEAPAVIYDAFAPCLPRSVRRFLFRTRSLEAPCTFGLQLANVARERQDCRLWLDYPEIPGPQVSLESHMDDVRLGLALWEQGFQLYDPLSFDL
ncbi:hypothetical protein AURDEDRAFT_174150 [Auricularia subglabra TFB-10046 SS5]|nr:hypothetical protein AURDEDRAFT_174150 [Auricularia subglabra TFB-10046 SS5]